MSWITPTFSGEGSLLTPPKKRSKTTKSSKTVTPKIADIQPTTCSWFEKYKPKDVNELAVHVKKIKEVENWLKQSNSGLTSTKYLLITGPSGCGKTTTLETVCKSLNFKIHEWITPLDRPSTELEFLSRFESSKSAAKLFEEYLFRSSRYSSCLSSNLTRKLVLVKDLPNIFLHNPSTFHEILENFFVKCMNPIVFICSDESQCRKLFPITVKTNCQIQTIALNPIPDQRMLKVLKTILLQETKTNRDIKMLPDEALFSICSACQGDIRSAISKLYFCSINSDFDILHVKSQGKFKKPARSDENAPTEKDRKLDFFHGIGRVLYPKKIESEHGFRFVHSTETMVENFLSEPNNFISQLHENYPTKLGNIYDISDAAARLANSDILMTRWQDKDIFHTYSLSVAVQGLMVCNKNPQKAKFEAFRKSQTSHMEVDSKSIELEGKSIFSDLCILHYEQLIDILPYSRLLFPNLNQGQLEYVRKTCQFK